MPFINEVLSQAGPCPAHVLELYSGSGFFSIPLSRLAREVIGIDGSRTAVLQARENARLNERINVKFFARPVVVSFGSTGLRPDVRLLDMSRAGCGVKS